MSDTYCGDCMGTGMVPRMDGNSTRCQRCRGTGSVSRAEPRREQTGATAAVDTSNTLAPEVLALIEAAREVDEYWFGGDKKARLTGAFHTLRAALTPFDRTEKT